MPAGLAACVYPAEGSSYAGYGRSGLCSDSGISLRPLPAVANSFNMSSQLLQVCTSICYNLHANF